MLHNEYQITVDLVRRECEQQIKSAELPAGLQDLIQEREILFGEHPLALAVLPIVIYRALGGPRPADIAPAAAAIEFLLAAADVLDDIQDGAVPDRADPQLHAHYVSEIELVTALLLLGEQAMISLIKAELKAERVAKAASIFNTFKLRSFSGQYADAHGALNPDCDVETSLEITRSKSGSLGRCAAEVGAALATGDSRTIELSGDYGEHLAVARQFHDDVANLWPSTGKLDDLEQLRATLPLTFTLSRAGGETSGSALSLQTLAKPGARGSSNGVTPLLNGDLLRARDEVFAGGGVHFALLQAAISLVKARSIGRRIEKLPPGEGVLEQLASA